VKIAALKKIKHLYFDIVRNYFKRVAQVARVLVVTFAETGGEDEDFFHDAVSF
jgi:hypothetical protein